MRLMGFIVLKKTTLIFLVSFFFITKVLAADDFIAQLQAKYSSLVSWTADFEQTTLVEMLNQTLVKQGKITVARPDKIRIEYLSTPEKIYLSNGIKLWVYKPSETTAWQFDHPQAIISQEALSFLGGLNDMATLFKIQPATPPAQGGLTITDVSLRQIDLVPYQQDAVQKITLGVDPKTFVVTEALLYNTSGNVTHYKFSNIAIATVSQIPDSFFELPKEPKRKIVKK